MELPINQRTQRVLSKIPCYFGCDVRVAPEKHTSTLSAVNRALYPARYAAVNFGHKVRDCVPPGKLASDPRWHANSSLSVSQTSRHYEYSSRWVAGDFHGSLFFFLLLGEGENLTLVLVS